MDMLGERALRELRGEFEGRLEPDDYVLDYLFQNHALPESAIDRIRTIEKHLQVRELIDCVIKKSVVLEFLEALNYNGGHKYLSKLLSNRIEYLRSGPMGHRSEYQNVNPNSREFGGGREIAFGRKRRISDLNETVDISQIGCRSIGTSSSSESGDTQSIGIGFESFSLLSTNNESEKMAPGLRNKMLDPDETVPMTLVQYKDYRGHCTDLPKYTAEGEIHNVSNAEATEEIEERMCPEHQPPIRKETIPKQLSKVDIMTGKRTLLTKVHYHLKLLSHDGQTGAFSDFMSKYKCEYANDPDVRFALLDAEVESRRLVYDTDLHRDNIFDEMERCVRSSSHPVANAMTFLARKGSARTMKESLEVGLKMVSDALALSEHIQPCKDTGMVLYIFINIQIQMYEKDPTAELKRDIIRNIDIAINMHFANSPSFLREDYIRMLLLKMIFCYLGIGLFGHSVPNCTVSESDVRCAEACFKIIDESDLKFDRRRKMFYFLAKSNLLRRLGNKKEASELVQLAELKAKKCNFKKELDPISELSEILSREVAEQDSRDREEREIDIEHGFNTLTPSSEQSLVDRYLSKRENQWDGQVDEMENESTTFKKPRRL